MRYRVQQEKHRPKNSDRIAADDGSSTSVPRGRDQMNINPGTRQLPNQNVKTQPASTSTAQNSIIGNSNLGNSLRKMQHSQPSADAYHEPRTYLLSSPTAESVAYSQTYATIATLLMSPVTQLVYLVPQSYVMSGRVCEMSRLPRASGSGIQVLPVPERFVMRANSSSSSRDDQDLEDCDCKYACSRGQGEQTKCHDEKWDANCSETRWREHNQNRFSDCHRKEAGDRFSEFSRKEEMEYHQNKNWKTRKEEAQIEEPDRDASSSDDGECACESDCECEIEGRPETGYAATSTTGQHSAVGSDRNQQSASTPRGDHDDDEKTAVNEVVRKVLRYTRARAFDGYLAFEPDRASWTFLERVGRGVKHVSERPRSGSQ